MKVNSIEEIKKFWDSNVAAYQSQEGGLNGFYYTLINMLKIERRQSILEVGAGSGFLYNHSLHRKHPNATYCATDLSDSMLVSLCERMGVEYKACQVVEVPLYNLKIEKANGEELQYKNEEFDCYIANLCLHITTNPQKMISEAFRVLQKGGFAGFTVWGDEVKSKFLLQVPQILNQQLGVEPPKTRSNFHLNNKETLIKMLEEQGFTNIMCWNQFQPFPFVGIEDQEEIYKFQMVRDTISKAPEKEAQIKAALLELYSDIVIKQKEPIGLDGLMIIAQKP